MAALAARRGGKKEQGALPSQDWNRERGRNAQGEMVVSRALQRGSRHSRNS